MGGLLEDASLLMADVAVAVDEREIEEREKRCDFLDARARGFKATVQVLVASRAADPAEVSSEETASSFILIRCGSVVSGKGRGRDVVLR